MQQQHNQINYGNDNMIATTKPINTKDLERFDKFDNNIIDIILPKSISSNNLLNNQITMTTPTATTTPATPTLSLKSGIVIMKPDNFKFYTELIPDNNINDKKYHQLLPTSTTSTTSTSENTKDLLILTNNNVSEMNTINQVTSNIHKNLTNNSHYNYNNNIIDENFINNHNEIHSSTKIQNNEQEPPQSQLNSITESAFKCNLNSDNPLNKNSDNNNIITTAKPTSNPKHFISIQQNGWNTNLNIVTSSATPITLLPATTTTLSPIKTKNSSKTSEHIIIINNKNVNCQRSYIEDVHNYSKKSNNNYDMSSSGNNSSTEDYDDEIEYHNHHHHNEFNHNKPNNQKWLKYNNNNEIESNNDLNNDKINTEDDNNDNDDDDQQCIRNKMNKKCETPDSDLPNFFEKITPDHHARRPMNAFLIFCKRHRAIVRDKYKNVENRQITKILGEWWANMTKEDKSCYTDLAKENKDAFLSANPSFKWYKLPAPPLRTLSTRPQHTTDTPLKIITETTNNLIQSQLQQQSNTTNNLLHHKKQHHSPPRPTNIKSQIGDVGVFKFADETQMGGLNSLMCGNSPDSCKSSNSSSSINQTEQLQNTLGETSEFLTRTMTSTNLTSEPFENMRDHAIKMKNSKSIASGGIKRKLHLTVNTVSINNNGRKLLKRDLSFSSSEDDASLNQKLARSCKGKKYQELVSSGQITILTKKPKKSTGIDLLNGNNNRNSSLSNNSSSDSDYFNTNTQQTDMKLLSNTNGDDNTSSPISTKTSSLLLEGSNSFLKKPFDIFDLDSKIMALPAQCLDQYLHKKQESKSKKKINSKRLKTCNNNNDNKMNIINPCTTFQELKEQIVGSQKRKARKESITRRDVNAIQNDVKCVNLIHVDDNGEMIEVKTELDLEENQPNDLLFLAHVASNVDE